MTEPTILTPLRKALAGQALMEQHQLLLMLREYIVTNDKGGEIESASRGIFRRAVELGDAVMEAIGECDDLNDEQLIKLVGCPAVGLPGGPE